MKDDPEDDSGLLVVRVRPLERVDPGPALGVLKTVLDPRGVCTIVGRGGEPTWETVSTMGESISAAQVAAEGGQTYLREAIFF